MHMRHNQLAVVVFFILATYTTPWAQPSAQVTNLSALHRSGQTFLTWDEISGADVTYRVYRSSTPILDVSSATYIGTVDQLSSVNKRVGSAVYYIIRDNGSPLSDTTGLMVYTVVSSGDFYYAVTANDSSGEHTSITLGANALSAPVSEAVGLPEPILQGPNHYVHWVNWHNTPLLPAMGNKPGLAYNFMCRNIEPSKTQILNVGLYGGMNDYTDSVHSIDNNEFKLSVDNPPPDLFGPQPVGANDFVNPPNTGWYGYGDNFIPQQTLTSGVVPNYTQLRVIYLVKWVLRTWPQVDPNRVYLTGNSFGGYGAVQLGMSFPNVFAAIWAKIPRFDMGGLEWDLEHDGPITTRYKNIWGTVQSNLPTTNIQATYPDYAAANEGYNIYDRLDMLHVASQNPHIDFPVMLLGVGKQDRQAGWHEKPRFARAMNASYHQFFLYWENSGHKFSTIIFDNVYKCSQLLKYRLNQSYVSINNLSIDDSPGAGNDLLPGGTVTGEPQGTINGYAEWDPNTIVDTATEYRVKVYLRGTEMDQFADTQGVSTATATLTPRRLQQFPRTPNKQYTYENRRATDNALMASGQVTADANGLVHVANFSITRDGNLLILKAGNTTPTNQPPQAVAAANPTAGVAPLTVQFTGANSTDPEGNLLSYVWNFGDGTSSTLADPQHTYQAAGNYAATLTVTDNGGLSNTSSPALTVAVSSSPPPNQPPVVQVGPNQTLTLPASATLTGTATDDGLPTAPLTFAWTQVSGPSPVAFTTPQTLTTTATFATAGTYVLRLSASDGALTSSADVTLTVVAPPSVNQPPVVSAGPDQLIALSASAALVGTVADDGLPGGPLTLTWSRVSGPGTVTFTNPAAASTTATFTAAGTYVLRCTAHDGALQAADEVVVIVEATGPTTVVETRILASADDADESTTGSVKLASSSLEVGGKKMGLRFPLAVPPEATIVQAYVQFTVYERGADSTTVLIEGEANDNVGPFTSKTWDITTRPRTLTAVAWTVPAWPTTGAAGLDQRTPDLAPLLQEIIERPGWASGQAVGVLFTGSGRRRVKAYDGSDPAGAALLHVEYTLGPANK